jgi:hypothetical protein
VEGLAAAAADRVEALWVEAAEGPVGAEEEQGSATVDFAAARAAPVREAAEGDLAADLPTAVRRAAVIVLPFNPFRDPADRARAIRAAVDPVRADRHQILLDRESRDRIGPVSVNQVIVRVIDQATAIGLVIDRGTVPETATDRASLEKGTALGIDPATVRGFTHRLTATDLATGRAIVRITVTDRDPASPAIPIIQAAVRRTGTDIGSRSITVGITARGTVTGITGGLIGTPIRGAPGA